MSRPEQMVLPFKRDPSRLRLFFESVAHKSVSLVITDNSASMLSVREKGGLLSVRLHKIFLIAKDEVLQEIALFIKQKKGATPLLRDFLRQNSCRLKRPSLRRSRTRTEGTYHNLASIYDSLNAEYFGSRKSCAVTWGSKPPTYGVRKRILGSYSESSNTIRINPMLDRKTVPRYFVAFVIFHEMLHADTAISVKNGRRQVHTRAFKERERTFRHYARARAWEKRKGF